jgi:hypothetical protein
MTDDTRRNFLGIPISGDPIAGSTRVEQYPREDFEAIVARVLADEFFVDFGWTQYTPYFNDGDPCEFGANGFWIRTMNDVKPPVGPFTFSEIKNDEDDEDDEDEERESDTSKFEVDYDHPTLGELTYPDGYWGPNNQRKEPVYVGDYEAKFLLARELSFAIDDGHFENVLLDLFGDHCKVRVTRNGITIDEYPHD